MKLKAWRAQKVLTQRELSNLSGVSTFTIMAIEQGKHKPTTQTARKLAGALGLEDPLEIDEVKEAMERMLEGPKKDPVGSSPTG